MDLPGGTAALLEQARYVDLLAAVPDPQTAPEILAVLRCRADQGYSRAAADLFRSAPPAARADPVLRLWDAFLDLYRPSDIPLAERIAALEESCDSAEEPLAEDLKTRAQTFRFVLSGQGAAGRTSLVAAMTAAADRYQQAGQPREALATLRRAAAFAADGLRNDRDTARQLYTRARSRSPPPTPAA